MRSIVNQRFQSTAGPADPTDLSVSQYFGASRFCGLYLSEKKIPGNMLHLYVFEIFWLLYLLSDKKKVERWERERKRKKKQEGRKSRKFCNLMEKE